MFGLETTILFPLQGGARLLPTRPVFPADLRDYRAHPWLVDLLSTERPIGPGTLTWFEWLYEVAAEIQKGRLLTMHAAWKLDSGDKAQKEVSMAKIHVADKALSGANRLQLPVKIR